MTSYDAGRRLEWDVRKRLIADGYQLVLRSAGSKTKVDIVAFKLDQVLFVQARRTASARRPSAWSCCASQGCCPGSRYPSSRHGPRSRSGG